MKTTYVTPEEYAKAALEITADTDAVSEKKPEHFKKVMRENRGSIQAFSPYGPTDDGLERKNPVIVALGDSVTAGHFEFAGNLEELMAMVDKEGLREDDVIEITDARVCYLEQFRGLLLDKYEQTSVSTINAGIAGDTMHGMYKRVYRDVVRYQPDLVIINGSLNWSVECGDTEDYRKILTQVIKIVKNETKADIVLLTPNMEIPGEFANPNSPLEDRVQIIRELSVTEDVCLADVFKVWEAYRDAGYPIVQLLANGMNHPSVTGHEIYARVLMKLMD